MKFAKLIFFSLALIGASFSQASNAPKMLDKATWIIENAWKMTSDRFDSAYAMYVAKWQKEHPVAQQAKKPTVAQQAKKPIAGSFLRQLVFPPDLPSIFAVKAAVPPVSTGSASAPAPTASVVMPEDSGLDNLSRLNLSRERGMEYVSPYPETEIIAPSGSGDWYSALAAQLAPALAAKAVATSEEDWDPFSTGDTDLFAGLNVYPPSLAGASSLAIGDDLNNLVYLEHKLFNDNYDQLISLSRAQKLALLQSKADEEAREHLLAELAATLQRREEGRYSTATNSSGDGGAIVASGDFDFGDWGDSADVFGNFEGANGDGASALAIDTDNVVHVEATLYNSKTDPVDYATLLAHDLAWKQAKLGSV